MSAHTFAPEIAAVDRQNRNELALQALTGARHGASTRLKNTRDSPKKRPYKAPGTPYPTSSWQMTEPIKKSRIHTTIARLSASKRDRPTVTCPSVSVTTGSVCYTGNSFSFRDQATLTLAQTTVIPAALLILHRIRTKPSPLFLHLCRLCASASGLRA